MLRRISKIAGGLVLFVALVSAAGYVARFELLRWRMELPAFTHAAGDESKFDVAMRDGVRLATTVYQPRGDGPWPTILIRNPYDAVFLRAWCGLFVRYGYACVFQEARGQMESEGDWDPLLNEPDDGEDALAWLVAQPFQDANVALYGPSYLAAVQWAAASRGLPPEVKTMVPIMFGTDLHRMAYERGMFRHEILTAWSALMPGRGFKAENGEHYQSAIRHRPHVEVDERYFGARLDWYRKWVSSPSPAAPLWQLDDFRELMATPGRMRIPVLAIAGWYDIALGPQLRDWQELATRDQSKLVIGPWTHVMEALGDLELPDARGSGYQWELVLDWLNHHLRGGELEQAIGVERYVIGEGRWQSAPEWPPATRLQRWHLADLGRAHGCDGARLAAHAPTGSGSVSYVYDPDDPVPMRGGAGALAFILPGFDGGPPASVLQEGLCERADVLSFASDPLEAPLHLAGAIRVRIEVSSEAPDTAFTAKLVEVRGDGRAYNVRDGIATLAYRNASDASSGPRPYEPESVATVEIETWPIEWVFAQGSRLRLDISSSNFPAYHAHPNRAGVWAEQTDAAPARQTLHAGELLLPVALR